MLGSGRDQPLRIIAKQAFLAHWKEVIVFLLWLGVVLAVEARHELWRDEVHAISIVEQATSPLDLAAVTRGEGHPLLWFVLLDGYLSVGRTGIVSLSVVIGAIAAAVFLFSSPFPFWFRSIFVFGVLPLYDYTVMFRPYGLTMLLAFMCAWLFGKRRIWPLRAAAVLALLANSTLPGFVCAVGFLGLWVVDAARVFIKARTVDSRTLLALLVAVAALGLSADTMRPPENSTLVVPPVSVTSALVDSVKYPDGTIAALFPHFDRHYPGLLDQQFPRWAVLMVIALGILGLMQQPWLAAAAAGVLVTLGFMSRRFYTLEFRHQGFYFVFLVCLYWILRAPRAEPDGPRRGSWGRYLQATGLAAVALMALSMLQMTPPTVGMDLDRPMSSNAEFGAFLRSSPQYRTAIVLSEPDYLMESLPYYADNPIYIPRERRFGRAVQWTTANKAVLTLGTLLDEAVAMRTRTREVLIAIGHRDFDRTPQGSLNYWRDKVFSWTSADLDRLHTVAEPVKDFWAATTDENYTVYRIK